jgi:hypothetical protein
MRSHRQRSCRQEGVCALVAIDSVGRYDPTMRLFFWADFMGFHVHYTVLGHIGLEGGTCLLMFTQTYYTQNTLDLNGSDKNYPKILSDA